MGHLQLQLHPAARVTHGSSVPVAVESGRTSVTHGSGKSTGSGGAAVTHGSHGPSNGPGITSDMHLVLQVATRRQMIWARSLAGLHELVRCLWGGHADVMKAAGNANDPWTPFLKGLMKLDSKRAKHLLTVLPCTAGTNIS